MSIISNRNILSVNTLFYAIDNLFTLSVQYNQEDTFMTMQVLLPVTTTAIFPSTKKILEKLLPSILLSTCFNEEDLPFNQEVENTEIGHLFEHILLEYLCLEKLSYGYKEAVFSGRTNWNWQKDEEGTFHIIIDSGHSDAIFFPHAIEKSAILLRGILEEVYDTSRGKKMETYTIPHSLSSMKAINE